MIKKLNTFIRVRPQLKLMILQAFALSVYTGFIFAFFNRYARFGERIVIDKDDIIVPGPDETLRSKINDIARAIRISSKYIPWKNVCRHQAYQAKLFCNFYKIPYRIFIGFKKDKEKNEIQAHAWTIAAGNMITGFCNPEEYIVQSIYRNKWQ